MGSLITIYGVLNAHIENESFTNIGAFTAEFFDATLK